MTIDEAIKNREDCLKYLENIGRRANPECVEAVRWSVKALKAMRSVTTGNPLTLEQLRERNGRPVWIVESPDWGHWELSEDAEDYVADRDAELYGLTYPPDPEGNGIIHKLGWLAYAYPPANIDKEAWTAEWVPMTDDDGCTWFECSKCEYDLDSLDEKPLFCLGCGRAMNEKGWAVLEKRLRG